MPVGWAHYAENRRRTLVVLLYLRKSSTMLAPRSIRALLLPSGGVHMKRILCTLLLCIPLPSVAAEYRCVVERKVDFNHEYTAAQLKKGQFSNLIEESTEGAFVSRCSFSSIEGKVTCDRYKMDRVDLDPNVKIKKFYNFRSQFSLQVFPKLAFVEDNGRGSISFGRCQLTAP